MITKHGIEITFMDRVRWWWDGDHDVLMFFGLLLGAVVLCVAIVTAIAYPLGKCECRAKAAKQGFEWSYGLFEGCMIKLDDGWLDYNKWIGVTKKHKTHYVPMRVIK